MMKALPVFVVLLLIPEVNAASNLEQTRRMEAAGDTLGARALLARAAQNNSSDPATLSEYAQFLDRYGDAAVRPAYEKLLAVLRASGDRQRAGECARRLAALHLLAGDREAARRALDAYREATGATLELGAAAPDPIQRSTIHIPGPIRSFARMAAISPDINPNDILPAVARNVVTNGYQASHSNDALEQTEYLKLVHRYLSQARELEKLSGAEKAIVVENCESPKAADLLRILGFRMRGGCGSEVVLETVNATRAFLTTDSGFPINELEQALRTNRPYRYEYAPTPVPVLYTAEFWQAGTKEKEGAEFIDTFLGDPSLCRLYLGLSKLDRETGDALRKQMSVTRLKAFSHVLDFFGGMFEIRNGKAMVPGGQRAYPAWAEIVGASPDHGAQFFEKLLARDDGWMASLYDALARIRGPVRDYLVDPTRLKRFYGAVRGRITSPGPARPVFRSNTDMMLLTTRLRLDASGKPHVPGSLEIWRNLFVNHPHGKYDGKLTKAANSWKDADDVLEALFALSRKAVENEPLKIFMAMTDIDRNRPKPLEAATVDRLARRFRQYSSQYSIFAESPDLSDKSILEYMDTAEAINKIRDPLQRANTAGTMQALVGLWQIFVRQRSLPPAQADAAFSSIVARFPTAKNNRDLFDAGRAGVKTLLAATGTKPEAPPQDRLVDLLAGAAETQDAEVHTELVQEMVRILEAQRIISLNALFQLADHLDAVAKGEKLNVQLVNRLASRVSEIQAPRAALSSTEKNALGFGYWTEKHIENQRKLNLKSAVERAAADKKTPELRGLLAPILRDTLVAYNYVHYAPPGAQILFTNPVFVRSHDFLGVQGTNQTWRHTEMFGTGWPSNGGGRLVGSLAGLPYALAEAEQNFLIPSQTQALIWGDLVPQMILSAKIPRWWDVTPAQLHWVGLHLRYGRGLIAESALDAGLRAQVIEALSMFAPPARTREVARLLAAGEVRAAADRVTPSEFYAIAREVAALRKTDDSSIAAEIRRLATAHPDTINYPAISRAFGTPKPTLANSYQPELLTLRTFPTLMGYSSRIMAESWESNTLYWAALADETHLPPSQLNLRIPEWTQKLVEQIFASHLEDWPAVLKSLHAVGEDVRKRSRGGADQKASLLDTTTAAGVR
jgi:hypothetical protein